MRRFESGREAERSSGTVALRQHGVRRHSGDRQRGSSRGGNAPGKDDTLGTLHGYFSVFTKWAEVSSASEGNFLEMVAPGAFRKTMAENKLIRCLFQHGRDPVVGLKPLGPITHLREDDTGAYYEVELLDTSFARDLLEGLKNGLFGASFRFRAEVEEVRTNPGRSHYNPKGLEERIIVEANVSEFGPVTWGAYADATALMRSAETAVAREATVCIRARSWWLHDPAWPEHDRDLAARA